jgi:hypothetical protein
MARLLVLKYNVNSGLEGNKHWDTITLVFKTVLYKMFVWSDLNIICKNELIAEKKILY